MPHGAESATDRAPVRKQAQRLTAGEQSYCAIVAPACCCDGMLCLAVHTSQAGRCRYQPQIAQGMLRLHTPPAPLSFGSLTKCSSWAKTRSNVSSSGTSSWRLAYTVSGAAASTQLCSLAETASGHAPSKLKCRCSRWHVCVACFEGEHRVHDRKSWQEPPCIDAQTSCRASFFPLASFP